MNNEKQYSKGPYGLMFHYFHDNKKYKRSQGSISKDDFENILKKIGLTNILPAEKWAEKAINNHLGKNDICITFDDGLLAQYDIARPVLNKYKLTAFWFVNSAPLVGENVFLEVFRRFRNEFFISMEEFYNNFFSNALDSEYEKKISKGLESFPKNYLSEFKFYTYNDRKFRYVRDKILEKNEYENIMISLIQAKGLNVTDLAKDLWLEKKHLIQLKMK